MRLNHRYFEPAKLGWRRWSQKAKDMELASVSVTSKHFR